MADARRISLLDAAGQIIGALDVSTVDHANTMARMQLAVETRCDLGEWHRSQIFDLVPWGQRIREPQ